jgi:sugar lactone lactonase YvrE
VQHLRAAPAIGHRAEHGEGPCWDPRTGQLLWVDQYAGLVHLADYDPMRGILQIARTYEIGMPVGAAVPLCDPEAGWMLACGHGFAHLGVDGQIRLLDQPEATATRRMRMNDGKCAPDGAFWAGSMAWDMTPAAGTLYRLDTQLAVRPASTDVTISNGLAWSADGQWLYYIDTPTQRVDRLRLSGGAEIVDSEPVIVIDAEAGRPDGMSIDAEGCLWVALWDGWAVRRYAPDGQLLAEVAVSAPQVSSCCFGGPDLRTLFITTSQENMDDQQRDDYPHSGQVFRVRTAVAGPPTATFAGVLS